MATKKKSKTTKTKKGSSKKSTTVTSSSRAPYILIIMAMAAGLLFLLSLQSDSIKSFIAKKTEEKKQNTILPSSNEMNKEKKQVENTSVVADSKNKNTQELSPQKKQLEKEKPLIQAKIYFLFYNEKADKIELRPVTRNVDSRIPVKAALEELIKGPTKDEEKKGYVTAIPPTLKVIDVSIINNIAFINFNRAIEEGAAGNIMLNRLDQIIYTVTQFDAVDGIHILVNGQRKRFLGPDGISIAGPLKRH
ncbi:MAG: GerMN domain-containing protein [Spirochaetes bacterium]|nr:GerMN domain-containing protein [Spirochaetota bacterium]